MGASVVKSKLRDADIRSVLERRLLATFSHDPTLIVHELGLCLGDARIDLAAVNGELHGWEIKSEADSLDRLAVQADVYGRVLDRVILVAYEDHLEDAIHLVPGWWGLWGASSAKSGAVILKQRRRGRRNFGVDPIAVAELLWRDELEMELVARGQHGLSRLTAQHLRERIVKQVALPELQRVVRERLRARPGWPAVGLRTQCDG